MASTCLIYVENGCFSEAEELSTQEAPTDGLVAARPVPTSNLILQTLGCMFSRHNEVKLCVKDVLGAGGRRGEMRAFWGQSHYATFSRLGNFPAFCHVPPGIRQSISATNAIPAQVQHIAVEQTSCPKAQHVKPPFLTRCHLRCRHGASFRSCHGNSVSDAPDDTTP